MSSNALGAAGLRRLTSAAWAPGLRAFRMSFDRAGWGEGLGDALHHEGWSGLRELVFSGAYACPGLSHSLAGSAALSGIETLGLNWDLLGGDGARVLFEGSVFTHLETLDLRRNLLRLPGAEVLAAARLPALREVLLQHNLFGAQGARVLAASEWSAHAKVRT